MPVLAFLASVLTGCAVIWWLPLSALVAEYLPAGQFLHIDADEAPVNIEYLPAGQFLHIDADEAPLASGLLAGCAVFACVWKFCAVVAEYLPAGQFLHINADEAPVNIEYLPEGQSLQVDADVAFLASGVLAGWAVFACVWKFCTRGCRVLAGWAVLAHKCR